MAPQTLVIAIVSIRIKNSIEHNQNVTNTMTNIYMLLKHAHNARIMIIKFQKHGKPWHPYKAFLCVLWPVNAWDSFLKLPAIDWDSWDGLRWPVEQDWIYTFLWKIGILFCLFTPANLFFLPWIPSVYVMQHIRSTKTNWILPIMKIWFGLSWHMISFQIWPNHALFVPITIDSNWSCKLIKSWLLTCQKKSIKSNLW